jgi:hypothetical protein
MDWAGFFVTGWGSAFSAYVVLQALTLVVLKRPLWYAAAVPVPLMLWVAIATVQAWQQHSNLWPLPMIFTSPVAVLYLLLLGTIGLVHQAHSQRRGLVSLMFAVVIGATLPYVMFAFAG